LFRRLNEEMASVKDDLVSKAALERSRAALLSERIADQREALKAESTLEDSVLTELEGSNAGLHGQLQRARTGGSKPPQAPSSPTNGKLTTDEAMAAAILAVQDEYPDAVIQPAESRVVGTFRTYSVNGAKVLVTVKHGEVRVRRGQAWVSLSTFLAQQADEIDSERERRDRIRAEHLAREKVDRDDAEEIKRQNKQLRYRQLADAYERDKRKYNEILAEGGHSVAAEHARVEALEAELRQIEDIQRAARARRHELLDGMDEKNRELLARIADAEKRAKQEELSALVFASDTRTATDKKRAAVKARREYAAARPLILFWRHEFLLLFPHPLLSSYF
jgi:hypothetical protein